jgi:hypothetical protein
MYRFLSLSYYSVEIKRDERILETYRQSAPFPRKLRKQTSCVLLPEFPLSQYKSMFQKQYP